MGVISGVGGGQKVVALSPGGLGQGTVLKVVQTPTGPQAVSTMNVAGVTSTGGQPRIVRNLTGAIPSTGGTVKVGTVTTGGPTIVGVRNQPVNTYRQVV